MVSARQTDTPVSHELVSPKGKETSREASSPRAMQRSLPRERTVNSQFAIPRDDEPHAEPTCRQSCQVALLTCCVARERRLATAGILWSRVERCGSRVGDCLQPNTQVACRKTSKSRLGNTRKTAERESPTNTVLRREMLTSRSRPTAREKAG